MTCTVASFYRFAELRDPGTRRASLLRVCEEASLKGTILLASEGVNGSIAGSKRAICTVLEHLRRWPGFETLEPRWSTAAQVPFRRLKVRLKNEIVSLRRDDCDPLRAVGTYLSPSEWDDVIARDDVVTIDTRNDYETSVGTFPGALRPPIGSFSDFPRWFEENRETFAEKRIAMFCTGGIRCEKATSWLIHQGYRDVLHLEGGVLAYLEQVPAAKSSWQGECYVFDGRVTLGHALEEGTYSSCGACGRPVDAAGRSHPDFEEGISCAACIAEYSASDRRRFAERHRQWKARASEETERSGDHRGEE